MNFKGKPVVGYMVLDPATGTGAYIIEGSSGAEVELQKNLILGLIWGILFLPAFTSGLLGIPFYVPILISLGGTLALARTKFGLTGNSDFNSVATFIGLVAGSIGALQIPFILKVFGLGSGTPVLALTPFALGMIIMLSLIIIRLIIIDYMFSFAMEFRDRKWKGYA